MKNWPWEQSDFHVFGHFRQFQDFGVFEEGGGGGVGLERKAFSRESASSRQNCLVKGVLRFTRLLCSLRHRACWSNLDQESGFKFWEKTLQNSNKNPFKKGMSTLCICFVKKCQKSDEKSLFFTKSLNFPFIIFKQKK